MNDKKIIKYYKTHNFTLYGICLWKCETIGEQRTWYVYVNKERAWFLSPFNNSPADLIKEDIKYGRIENLKFLSDEDKPYITELTEKDLFVELL